MAILASLLGKEVNFYPNSYYKNEAVYNYSLLIVIQKHALLRQVEKAAYNNTLPESHITVTALLIIACQPLGDYSFARL
ncbi:hypothetical protein M3O75_29010 [Klebsiella pneumoniae]|nr:hypothetical protein [Klebsiella pneumoniae]